MSTLWGEQFLPRLTDALLRNDGIGRYRERVAADLHDDVVEIGFGSGLNLSHYPAEVTRVIAIEPSHVARDLASKRVAASHAEVDFLGLDGQQLPIPDSSVDGALSTFTLCTIPDAQQALGEIYRVLRPGGTFAFLEHGISPRPGVAKWQERLNPVQKRFAGGCNLNRHIDELIERAGFTLEWIDREQLPGSSLAAPWSYVYYGVANKPE